VIAPVSVDAHIIHKLKDQREMKEASLLSLASPFKKNFVEIY